MFLLIAVFAFILFNGCTKEAWYEGMKETQRQDCYKIDDFLMRQQCLEQLDNMSYDQYKKEREAVINN
ncbi:MAG: hypothetical protein H6680_02745 [Desulfobacteraceae bacterium]|nr:hypothetical protein [Desulfobacteraceae bacterium]